MLGHDGDLRFLCLRPQVLVLVNSSQELDISVKNLLKQFVNGFPEGHVLGFVQAIRAVNSQVLPAVIGTDNHLQNSLFA